MSRNYRRSRFYGSNREWDPRDHSSRDENRDAKTRRRSRSHSPNISDINKRHSRTLKNDKDIIDDNILNEISKLPEPSELWDSNQFKESGHSVVSITSSHQTKQLNQIYETDLSTIYDDIISSPSLGWSSMNKPSASISTTILTELHSKSNEDQKMVARVSIDSESQHKKVAVYNKNENHINEASFLKNELEYLRNQWKELRGESQRSPSPETKKFLKENMKLQLEIQNKLKKINPVDTLDRSIGEDTQQLSESEEFQKARVLASNQTYNYVYYDPELHWCRVCNEFPTTAKDYLNHLHSPSHYEMAAQHVEAPWHSLSGVNVEYPHVPSAPTKRTPIRGLQFFVPQTGWYCKLCDQFIGDLHCASAHLKSITHSKNYNSFVHQNPHWETDWMSDRQRAYERARPPCSLRYTAHTLTLTEEPYAAKTEEKRRKRKKRSNSVSSSSGSPEDSTRFKSKKKSCGISDIIEVPDDDSLEELISINDKKLMENIKNRLKSKGKKSRSSSTDIAEMQRKIRESERRGKPSREVDSRLETLNRRLDSPDRQDISRDRLDSSRKKRDTIRDSRDATRDRQDSRDKQDKSRDRRDRGDIRDTSQERREESHRESRDRRERSRDKRDKSRSPARRDDKPDIKRMIVIGKMPFYKSMTEEQKKKEEMAKLEKEKLEKEKLEKERLEEAKKMIPAIALSAALSESIPPPVVVGTPTLIPTPQLPIPISAMPQDAQDFRNALEAMFPTDPQKCAQKVEQDLMNQALQRPGILGPSPSLLGVPPFGPSVGFMQPGVFGFNPGARMFPPAIPPLMNPGMQRMPQMPNINQLRPHQQYNMNRNRHVRPNVPRKNFVNNERKNNNVKNKELEELAMLGIDASDVGV